MAKEDNVIAILQESQETLLMCLTDETLFINWRETLNKESQDSIFNFFHPIVIYFNNENAKSVQHNIVPVNEIFEEALQNIDSNPELMRNFLRQHPDIENYISENAYFLKEMVDYFNQYVDYTETVIVNLQVFQETLLKSFSGDRLFMRWTETLDEESYNFLIGFSNDMLACFNEADHRNWLFAARLGKDTAHYRTRPSKETFESALRNIDSHPAFMRNFLYGNTSIKMYLSKNTLFLKAIVENFNDYLKSLNEDTPMHDLPEPDKEIQIKTDPETTRAVIEKLDEYKELMYDLKHLFQRSRTMIEDKSAIAQYDDLWISSDLFQWCHLKFNKKITITDFHRGLFNAIIADSDPKLHEAKVYLPFTNALSRYIAYNLNTDKVQLENSAALEKYLNSHPHVANFLLSKLDHLKKINTAFKNHLEKMPEKKRTSSISDGKSEMIPENIEINDVGESSKPKKRKNYLGKLKTINKKFKNHFFEKLPKKKRKTSIDEDEKSEIENFDNHDAGESSKPKKPKR